MRRDDGFAGGVVGVATAALRRAVAREAGGSGVDETAFLLEWHGLGVCANHLIEAIQAALLAVEEECELAAGDACLILIVGVLVLVGNVATFVGVDNEYILADDAAPVTGDVAGVLRGGLCALVAGTDDVAEDGAVVEVGLRSCPSCEAADANVGCALGQCDGTCIDTVLDGLFPVAHPSEEAAGGVVACNGGCDVDVGVDVANLCHASITGDGAPACAV